MLYEFPEDELDDDFLKTMDYLNHYRSLYAKDIIQNIKELTLENSRVFLIPILQAFQNEKISFLELSNIGSGLTTYLHRRYKEYYPDTCYPVLSEDDPRIVGLLVISYMEDVFDYVIFPEDIPFLIEALKSSDEQVLKTVASLYAYEDVLNYKSRRIEAHKRGYISTNIND